MNSLVLIRDVPVGEPEHPLSVRLGCGGCRAKSWVGVARGEYKGRRSAAGVFESPKVLSFVICANNASLAENCWPTSLRGPRGTRQTRSYISRHILFAKFRQGLRSAVPTAGSKQQQARTGVGQSKRDVYIVLYPSMFLCASSSPHTIVLRWNCTLRVNNGHYFRSARATRSRNSVHHHICHGFAMNIPLHNRLSSSGFRP